MSSTTFASAATSLKLRLSASPPASKVINGAWPQLFPVRTGSVTPKSPTVGVPTATARCRAPVSLETTTAVFARTPASSVKDVLAARLMTGLDASISIFSATACSCGPPISTGVNPSLKSLSAIRAQCSGESVLDATDAPTTSAASCLRSPVISTDIGFEARKVSIRNGTREAPTASPKRRIFSTMCTRSVAMTLVSVMKMLFASRRQL